MVIEKRWNFNENGFIAVVIQGFNSPTRTQGEAPENVGIPTLRGSFICAKYWKMHVVPWRSTKVTRVLGGIDYSNIFLVIAGAVCFALRKPNPVPGWFEFHEVFHLGTVIGYACHVVALYLIVCAL